MCRSYILYDVCEQTEKSSHEFLVVLKTLASSPPSHLSILVQLTHSHKNAAALRSFKYAMEIMVCMSYLY